MQHQTKNVLAYTQQTLSVLQLISNGWAKYFQNISTILIHSDIT